MMKANPISRREFVVSAGGALLWTVRAGASNDNLFQALVRRCGVLRLGYCSRGGMAPHAIEAQHEEQLAFLLSLCRPVPIQRHDATGAVAPGSNLRTPMTLMTALDDKQGLRLEVVTTATDLGGPELSLRGHGGHLCVAAEKVYFTEAATAACPWRDEANVLPGKYWNAFLALRHALNSRPYYAKTARQLTAVAAARLS